MLATHFATTTARFAVVWICFCASRGLHAGSFTNVAELLLQSQLGLSVMRIQVAPTNEYTPAVHRLLQVAANMNDAGMNDPDVGRDPFPSVFRPLFTCSGSNVFICGYTNDNNPDSAREWFAHAPAGIPMIVGAKKGLPSFNELVFQTVVQVTRKLELR